jgi:hypothetical protein
MKLPAQQQSVPWIVSLCLTTPQIHCRDPLRGTYRALVDLAVSIVLMLVLAQQMVHSRYVILHQLLFRALTPYRQLLRHFAYFY